jgi:hypothetical protein
MFKIRDPEKIIPDPDPQHCLKGHQQLGLKLNNAFRLRQEP